MKRFDELRTFKWFFVIAGIIQLTIVGTVIWVAAHFIAKYW